MTFKEWLPSISEEIVKMETEIRNPLSDDGNQIANSLILIESYLGRAIHLLAEANYYLDIAEKQAIMLIDSDLKVLEKEVTLKSECARERKIRDILRGMVKAIETKITVSMSLMKHLREGK